MIGGTLFFTDLLQSFKNRKIVMLAWQCRMACSMLDDFYLLLEYILRNVLDDVNAFNQTQHKAFACFVEYDSKRNWRFVWLYVKSIFYRTSFRILSRVDDFRFIKELEFYFKGNVSNKRSFSIKDSVLNWMCSPYWKILRLWKNCLG